MGAPTKLCIVYSTMRAAFTIATIASLALFARVSADTCANSCFSENCDFYVNSLGNSEITADHVPITDFSRRALSIAFEVETPYTDMSTQSSNIDALSSTLTSQMTSTASGDFITLFNTNAAAVVSGWTSVAAPSITVAAATITSAPTAAPTAATVVDSAPASAGLSLVSMAALALAVKQLL